MYVVCIYKLNYFNFSSVLHPRSQGFSDGCTSDEKDLSLGFRAFSIYKQTESVSSHTY
jgi:hypothetical protein